jgi:hypothetical protein
VLEGEELRHDTTIVGHHLVPTPAEGPDSLDVGLQEGDQVSGRCDVHHQPSVGDDGDIIGDEDAVVVQS